MSFFACDETIDFVVVMKKLKIWFAYVDVISYYNFLDIIL